MPTERRVPVKKLVVVYGEIKGAVRASETDTLQCVRALIEAQFDDDMFPSEGEFCFHVDGIRIGRKQEEHNLVWDILDDEGTTVSLHPMQTIKKWKQKSREEESTVSQSSSLKSSERDEATTERQASDGTCTSRRSSMSTEKERSPDSAMVTPKKTTGTPGPASDCLQGEAKSKSNQGQVRIKEETVQSPLSQESITPNAAPGQSHENVKASHFQANDRILQIDKYSAKKRTAETALIVLLHFLFSHNPYQIEALDLEEKNNQINHHDSEKCHPRNRNPYVLSHYHPEGNGSDKSANKERKSNKNKERKSNKIDDAVIHPTLRHAKAPLKRYPNSWSQPSPCTTGTVRIRLRFFSFGAS
jgi:hypothetical protein